MGRTSRHIAGAAIFFAAAVISVHCAWVFGLDEGEPRRYIGGDDAGAIFTFDPSEIGVVFGEQLDVKVSINRQAVAGEVTFFVSGEPPPNVTIARTPEAIGPTASTTTFTLKADGAARPGDTGRLRIEARTERGFLPRVELPMMVRGKPGTVDRTFGQNGIAYAPGLGLGSPSSWAKSVLVFDNGIYAAGFQSTSGSIRTVTARFLPDGAPDPSFGGGAIVSDVSRYGESAESVAHDSANRVLTIGAAQTEVDPIRNGPFLMRHLADGTRDPSFGEAGVVRADTGKAAKASSVLLTADGQRILTFATFLDDAGSPAGGAVLPLDGMGRAAGAPFGGDPLFSSYIDAVWSNPEMSSFLVGGIAAPNSGNVCPIKRFLADGNADTTFGNKGVCNIDVGASEVPSIAVQPDGKIVAGLQRGAEGGVVRLQADGTRDPTFAKASYGVVPLAVSGAKISIRTVALEPSGKIVAVFTGADPNGPELPRLFRILPDGTLDDTLAKDTGETRFRILGAALQRSGRRLIAAGTMTIDTRPAVFALTRYWL